MNDDHYKYPRLFISEDIHPTGEITLNKNQIHYLTNVLRRKESDKIRIFDGKNGEFFAKITTMDKKSCTLNDLELINAQKIPKNNIHLLFSPLKKHRMDLIIEKCTELGVTDFHPILTNRTEIRKIKTDKFKTHIINACQQSERLTVPALHEIQTLPQKITNWNLTPHIHACIERAKAPHISELHTNNDTAFLIGPVGGFDKDEQAFLQNNNAIKPLSLGENILRAETAAILCLSHSYISLNKLKI